MKTRLMFLFTFLVSTKLFSQDGSDILYTRADNLDSSYVGDIVHLDFYNRSFRGAVLDTITVNIDFNPIKFVEHREDNGFNNWFHRQYLESQEKIEGTKLRIIHFRIDSVSPHHINVTGSFERYRGGKKLHETPEQFKCVFQRRIIIAVLISAENRQTRKRD